MNTKFNKIAKTAAVGIFFMALLMNVKVSLTDPFVTISNDALAQSTSSNSYGGVCCLMLYTNCPHPYAGLIADSTWRSGVAVCP